MSNGFLMPPSLKLQKIWCKNWSHTDRMNTMWQHGFKGNPALVNSWNDAVKGQHMQKVVKAQLIDLTLAVTSSMLSL
jgi:hypothetical protein